MCSSLFFYNLFSIFHTPDNLNLNFFCSNENKNKNEQPTMICILYEISTNIISQLKESNVTSVGFSLTSTRCNYFFIFYFLKQNEFYHHILHFVKFCHGHNQQLHRIFLGFGRTIHSHRKIYGPACGSKPRKILNEDKHQ